MLATVRLMPAFLLLLLLALTSCDAVGLSGDCFVDDFRITTVVDIEGNEYQPEKLSLTSGFGLFEHDYCGIPSEARPFEVPPQGFQNGYRYFEVPRAGAEDTRTSLEGNIRSLPDSVKLGTSLVDDFPDSLSMWPLYDSEWR